MSCTASTSCTTRLSLLVSSMASTMFSLGVLLCSLAVVSWASFELHNHPSNRELLVDTLMTQYESRRSKIVIPSPVTVSVDIHVIRIDSLKNNVLTMVVWSELKWNDHRLSWDYDAIENITLPHDQIWRPDITPYTMDAPPSPLLQHVEVVVSQDGNVTLEPAGKIQIFCHKHSDNVALDVHNCTFHIGSWVHRMDELDLRAPGKISTDMFYKTEWNILDSWVERKEMSFHGVKYAVLEHTMAMQRTPLNV